MQITNTPPDPELTRLVTENKIGWAVAKKAMDVDKQQGDAAVALVKSAGQISKQLDANQIDVQL